MSERRLKIGDFAPTGAGFIDTKFQVEGVAFFFSEPSKLS